MEGFLTRPAAQRCSTSPKVGDPQRVKPKRVNPTFSQEIDLENIEKNRETDSSMILDMEAKRGFAARNIRKKVPTRTTGITEILIYLNCRIIQGFNLGKSSANPEKALR